MPSPSIVHCLFTCLMIQDVTEKDFPCGEIKEEKGIQVEESEH